MSIDTLPAGADVLAARRAEMAGHPCGWLNDRPEATFATVAALVSRTLALEAVLAARDGMAWPSPDPLADLAGAIAGRRPDLAGVQATLWPALELLVVRVPSAESRLAALEGRPAGPPGPDLDGLQQCVAEMVVHGGHLPRREGRAADLLKHLVGRVLDLEARLATPGASKP